MKYFLIVFIAPLLLFSAGKNERNPIPICPERALLASSRPCPTPAKPWFVSGSFILWQAKVWGLEFAAKSFIPNTSGASIQQFDEKLFFPDFAWRPGFKIEAGSNLPYDGWDIAAQWTYYRENFTSLKKHFASQIAPADIGMIPLWRYPFVRIIGGNDSDPIRYRYAAGNWKMFLNEIDLNLGRRFFPDGSIPMRLHLGAKAAWIRQHYHADYDTGNSAEGYYINFTSALPSTFTFQSSRFAFSSDQWGLGPRAGLESRWNLAWGVRLIANADFSLLCSSFDLHHEYTDQISEPTLGLTNAQMEIDEEIRELTPVIGAMLGLDWGMCFCKSYVNFVVGYEYQYWGSINHARRNYVQSLPGETFDMRGDLEMQGLTSTLKCDF